MQTADLNQVLSHSLDTARPLMEKQRQTLTIHLCSDPVWVAVDATRMEEVFVNLLGNASKYTQEGGSVEVWCERHANHALVRVRKSSPQQTSVQWTTQAEKECASPLSALVPTCLDLRASIDDAVRAGRLEVT